MDQNKQYNEPWEDGVYGIGNTQPPKNHGGLIALLLIVVIFLSGIVTTLEIGRASCRERVSLCV